MNNQVKECFHDWIENLQKVRNLSDNTLISYKNDIENNTSVLGTRPKQCPTDKIHFSERGEGKVAKLKGCETAHHR